MWVVWFLVCLVFAVPAIAETGFSEKYERDYSPMNQYRSDNPLNPAQTYSAPDNSFIPAHRYDPSNPTNPANRYIIPNNPFNPANQSNPQNPLNPANGYNPTTPFQSLNRSR